MSDNPFYYKNIAAVGDEIYSEPKEIGVDFAHPQAKIFNETGTAANAIEYEWVADNGENVFVSRLGNNGKMEPKLRVDISPAASTVIAGGKIQYEITVSNLTDSEIDDIEADILLPAGLTFVPGSLTVNGTPQPGGTFPYPIGSIAGGSSATLTFEAQVPEDAEEDAIYTGSALITSVGGNVLGTPAKSDSEPVTVVDFFVDIATPENDAVINDPTPDVTGTTDEDAVSVTLTFYDSDDEPVPGLEDVEADLQPDGSWSFTVPEGNKLEDGKYKVAATATDAEGHTATDEVTFTVDTQLEVEIDTPENDARCSPTRRRK